MDMGWIKLHRRIQEHWIYSEKPFSKFQAWVDLLLSASHKDKKLVLGNELISCERGQIVTSVRKLCERWGWSNTKVKNFLDLLQADGMITYNSDAKKTALTIVNYGFYQDRNDEETSEEHRGNDARTSEERRENDAETTREHTYKNDKNDKNEKNEKNGKKEKKGVHISSLAPAGKSEEPDGAQSPGKGEDAPAEKPAKGGAQGSGKGEEYTAEFEEFWSHYPRRVEKRRAFRVFKARLKEGVSAETLILAARNYAEYCRANVSSDKFIKHASTFLGPDKPYEEYLEPVPVTETHQQGKNNQRIPRAFASLMEWAKEEVQNK